MSNTEYLIEKVDELPPPQRRGRKSGVWIGRLQPLTEDPGEWYVVAKGNYANISRKAWLLGKKEDGVDKVKKPEGYWEFTTRHTGFDGETKLGALYARFLGTSA